MDAADYYGNETISAHIAERGMHRADRLRACLPDGLIAQRILDVGCGPGVQIRYLTSENLVVGVDAGFPLLRTAASNGYQPCQCNADKGRLPFRDGSFDLVVCTDVLEHLFAPEHLLGEIHRVLTPDGCALIGIPNHFDLAGRLRILFGGNLLPWWDRKEFGAWNYFHLHFWTLRDLDAFVKDGGFRIEKSFHFLQPSHFLHMLSLLTDREYLRDWHRRHRGQIPYRIGVGALSSMLRLAWFPRRLVKWLPAQFPSLFSGGFLVLLRKRAE